MALVVFLRGVNVGGHRTFRPSALAKDLSAYDVVNVGAAGTFVVRNPGSRAKFLAALRAKLPFETEIMICDGRDVLSIAKENPFGTKTSAEVVRFVSVRSKAGGASPKAAKLPIDGDWLVRIVGTKDQFVFGEYRRHMKTIGYLGQLDKLCGAPVTTRNWNTINAITRVLRDDK